MKLLLIQGNYIARYSGRQQKEVFIIDWNEDGVNRNYIENVRLGVICDE